MTPRQTSGGGSSRAAAGGLRSFGPIPDSDCETARPASRRVHGAARAAELAVALYAQGRQLIGMNVQLQNVLSDRSGVSGMAILKAILKGKRDPWQGLLL